MEIRKRVIESITVIGLMGDLDSRSAPSVQEQVLPSLPKDGRILLDLSGVPFVSSAGLRTMLLVYRQAQAVNSPVALGRLSGEVPGGPSAPRVLGVFVVAGHPADGLAALQR